ncbi:hypothetical protein WMF45_14835 [Sorangium sp. So ce448]|uniref:hypothetical protein n=1 Tax=Sorangium sp. So ce448 TaxID=3133314 RepID=UPI003F61D49C
MGLGFTGAAFDQRVATPAIVGPDMRQEPVEGFRFAVWLEFSLVADLGVRAACGAARRVRRSASAGGSEGAGRGRRREIKMTLRVSSGRQALLP